MNWGATQKRKPKNVKRRMLKKVEYAPVPFLLRRDSLSERKEIQQHASCISGISAAKPEKWKAFRVCPKSTRKLANTGGTLNNARQEIEA